MNKFIMILIVVSVSLISGCGDLKGMQQVQRISGKGEVVHIPDCSGCFLIRYPDGSIHYANSRGMYGDSSVRLVKILPPTSTILNK
tara:strand:- start:235 stop:492 length:258 start_codon:yes stop_codon:yes gene_type:complete